MSLVQRMTKAYDRVYGISDRLGIPQHCDFSYYDRITALTVQVLPRPRKTPPSENSLFKWQEAGVEVNKDTIYIKDISRTFDNIKIGLLCYINSEPYTIMWVDSSKSVTFNILCRPERSR